MQDIQKQIGAKIRALRTKKGWSQDVFAERCGLHRAHMGEIERGESNVTVQTLKIIADALGVRIRDLVSEL
ncbi:MAG TPA: helix-turn-helix transcriptional regulator [Bryobacteraceae bacterium]|nr:helix-turn-helix transcriptional regulator [Bryobacteraceae bacterium]HXJ15038.1 helix-turn-helix transcriptional regulator [Candidatus Limnocylindrales bacterium]HXJ40992.1 helix-turn-helix transcriptional regulator [Bryobacteraceae bacterium]